MTTLHVYVEGYDAYLRFLRDSGDWTRIAQEATAARQSPYGYDDALHRAWLEGWLDAIAETYMPPEFSEQARDGAQVTQSA